jgi:hypothetical protein
MKIKITNNLDKSFGPVGSSAGYFLILAGLVAIYTSLFGLILVVLGAFLGFTVTCTLIDFEKRRVKFSEKLFGILPSGKWVDITPGMKIGIKESNMVWTAYSRSNRSIDIDSHEFRLVLFDAEGVEVMPLQKTDTPEAAFTAMETMCKTLGLSRLE